jgi:hypothetical protein
VRTLLLPGFGDGMRLYCKLVARREGGFNYSKIRIKMIFESKYQLNSRNIKHHHHQIELSKLQRVSYNLEPQVHMGTNNDHNHMQEERAKGR